MDKTGNRPAVGKALYLLIPVLLLLLLLLLLLPRLPGAATKIGTGAFPDAERIEHSLVRGESTHADVQQLLGIPSGGGGALLPGYGADSEVVEHYDIWYYEDIEVGDISSDQGTMTMDMRQQILMILFKGDKFHGYFWTSNASRVEAR